MNASTSCHLLFQRAAYTRTSKKKSYDPSIQERNNPSTNQNNRVVTTKASQCCPRKNVPRNTSKDSNTTSLLSNTGCMGNENDCIIYQAIETSMSHLNDTVGDDCTKTPANCVAARIRSYSALRQSQWRKNNIGRSVNSVANVRSPLEEVSFNPKVREIESDDDEDALWKMSQQSSSEAKDDEDEPMVSKRTLQLVPLLAFLMFSLLIRLQFTSEIVEYKMVAFGAKQLHQLVLQLEMSLATIMQESCTVLLQSDLLFHFGSNSGGSLFRVLHFLFFFLQVAT